MLPYPLDFSKTSKCCVNSNELCRLYHRVRHWLLVTAQTGRLKSARSRMASCLSALQPSAVTGCCWMSPLSLCQFDRCRRWRLSVSSLRPICFLTQEVTRKINMLLLGWICVRVRAGVLVRYWYFKYERKLLCPHIITSKNTFIYVMKEKQLQVTLKRNTLIFLSVYVCR